MADNNHTHRETAPPEASQQLLSSLSPPPPVATQPPAPAAETKLSEPDAEPPKAAEAIPRKPVQSAAAPDPNGTSEQLKATTSRASTVVQGPIEVDSSKPEDFDGQVDTTNEIPSPETLKKIEDYVVLDKDGKSRKFKTLYSRPNVARRVLVIFIRHFFCGNCQDYIRTLCESITPDALLRLPVSTFVVIVGCGDPALIDMYIKATNCQFPIYTDPKRSLFDALGMTKTLAMGSKPAYMKRPMAQSVIASIGQGLRFLPAGLSLKSGDQRQVGGEFLFEPFDIMTPVHTPSDDHWKSLQDGQGYDGEGDGFAEAEEKRVTWCHRMKTTRDHCEIPELMEVLGLNGQGQPIKDQKRWEEALQKRKGRGESMARKMSEMSAQQAAAQRAGS